MMPFAVAKTMLSLVAGPAFWKKILVLIPGIAYAKGMRTLCSAGIFFWLFAAAYGADELDAASAAKKLGESVVVVDTVREVVTKESGTVFLNFGAAYPEEILTAVVMKETLPRFPGIETWLGKKIRMEGVVSEHEGHCRIVLRERGQILPVE
ncbi:MAG: hypothetical protein ACOYM3_09345 [Terrimicrobiaceae bacterium]